MGQSNSLEGVDCQDLVVPVNPFLGAIEFLVVIFVFRGLLGFSKVMCDSVFLLDFVSKELIDAV